jgi:hypothetical protein
MFLLGVAMGAVGVQRRMDQVTGAAGVKIGGVEAIMVAAMAILTALLITHLLWFICPQCLHIVHPHLQWYWQLKLSPQFGISVR